jgi:predicted small secreted protein
MKGDIMKRLIALAVAATFALPSFALLSGCNTVEGAGKDIQAGGSKIKEEARENKKY